MKFEGCYHGHADFLLVKAGSGALTFGVPDSAGVPAPTAKATITAPYNDVAALEALFAERGKEIAAVIVEPVVGNMGVVPPEPGFLEAIAAALQGARRRLDLRRGDDRLPRRARRDAGAREAPAGHDVPRQDRRRRHAARGVRRPARDHGEGRAARPVYQAGTLSGNPVAVSAALALLERLDASVYARLEALGARLEAGFAAAAKKAKRRQRGGRRRGRWDGLGIRWDTLGF